MPEKKTRKLVLNKRTLAMLSGEELGAAAGGRIQITKYCSNATCPGTATQFTCGCTDHTCGAFTDPSAGCCS